MRNLILFLTLIVFSKYLFAAPFFCDGTNKHPCIVLDTENNTAEIKNWRDTAMLAAAYKGNITGLNDLWVSGSATPSANGFDRIKANIQEVSQHTVSKMVDLDVRAESHGYLNQDEMNLSTVNDWINLGKSRDAIITAEEQWLNQLKRQRSIPNVLTHEQFKKGDYTHGVSIMVQSVQGEKEIAENAGFEYVRLTVTDHMAPSNEDVERFVNFIKSLPPLTWVHVHCRGGDGRTTTFMAMADMLKNADKVSFNDIIKRQASVSPFYDLSQTNRKNPALTIYYKQRLKFLMQFYLYANDTLQGYQGSWSLWLKNYQDHHVQ